MSPFLGLEESLELLKESYRPQVKKMWCEFIAFKQNDFCDTMPQEDDFLSFFKMLREKNRAASSMWTYYSLLNSLMKNRYSKPLQQYPRIIALLKGYNTDLKKKAGVFQTEEIIEFINHPNSTPYWLVRKVVIILAYFGGLRHTELMDLALEKVERKPEGLYVTHTRAKQRTTDKKETRFLVPSNGDVDYAAIVDKYLSKIRSDPGKFSGRMFWTGTPVDFRNSPLGKNTIAVVPKEMAKLLGKESFNDFTFHSLRRASPGISEIRFHKTGAVSGSSWPGIKTEREENTEPYCQVDRHDTVSSPCMEILEMDPLKLEPADLETAGHNPDTGVGEYYPVENAGEDVDEGINNVESLSFSPDLTGREKTQTAGKPLHCTTCGKGFSEPSHLNSDMMVHRYDRKDHWIVPADNEKPPSSRRCELCKLKNIESKSSFMCEKCNVGLHPACFKEYHINDKQ